MNEKDKPQGFHSDSNDPDEVEILEVVGVEDDVPAAASVDEPDDGAERALEEEDEVVLTFDDDSSGVGEVPPEGALPDAAAVPFVAPPLPGIDPSSLETELVQRLRADYDNLRKRVARERHEFEVRANGNLIERLLPILDNFERALAVQGAPGEHSAFHEGWLMIYNQLTEELGEAGLEAIESVGQPFDPNLHDAVATDPHSDQPPNTVLDELQRGYLFQERVLRPALVRVSVNGDLGAEFDYASDPDGLDEALDDGEER